MPIARQSPAPPSLLDAGSEHLRQALMTCATCGATVCPQTWSHDRGWTPHVPGLSPITGQAHHCVPREEV